MHRRPLLFPARFACLFLALVLAASCAPHRPISLPEAGQAVIAYYEGGAWASDVAAVADQGRAWLLSRLEKGAARAAVVFDVGDTLVSNYPVEKDMGFCFDHATWDAWVDRAEAPVIRPMRDLHDLLRERGVAVFLITARHEKHRAATEKNLAAAGYQGWEKLFMRPDDSRQSVQDYKTAARQRVEDMGYVILGNFGDQESDLAGGHAEQTFKLPNLMYVVE